MGHYVMDMNHDNQKCTVCLVQRVHKHYQAVDTHRKGFVLQFGSHTHLTDFIYLLKHAVWYVDLSQVRQDSRIACNSNRCEKLDREFMGTEAKRKTGLTQRSASSEV